MFEAVVLIDHDRTAPYRMFMDSARKQMLLPRMDLRSLHKACVNANVLKATSKVIRVYLGKLKTKTTELFI